MAETESRIDDARIATAFLTRLPLVLASPPGPGRLARASWAFPIVGLIAGLAGGTVYGAVHWLGLPPLLAAVFAVAAQIVLTGALHEDAIADVADGLGGGATPERKLDLMRDSRIGTFGALALMSVFAARLAAVSALAKPELVIAALVAAGAASRASMAAVMGMMPPARGDGLGFRAGRPRPGTVATALIIAAVLSLLALGPLTGTAGLAGAAAGAAAIASIAWRQIGGHTGDVLGASQQAAEVLCLSVIVAVA
ncbi:MAG: adenosylcobinamide-GDP ribazoletransferase [Rhodospirillales bacterium]|jgi:adenosylcobinamide-GDP ribazoletransferase|nr:adenosylcobinamide-GDP ribazoletransferase [Rhodospirillales bacterium]MDP6884100.1 adenosylcobinamide-GDP ribazoletransferase [Rhodospirillales bacterium]